MQPIIVAFACLLVVGGSLWGWGWLGQRIFRQPVLSWPATIVIGLAVVIFEGGVLNLARLVSPRACDAVIVVGLACTVLGLARSWRHLSFRPGPGALLPCALWISAAGLTAWCLLPESAYNLHDDLEKYFALPVRMLATGTLGTNPLSSVGAETLGAQAFLHAFVAAHFPLSYLGAVDGWFCLLLCLALAGFGRPTSRTGLGSAAAILCTLAIDPLIVNVSPLFSGTALMAAAIFLSARIDEPDVSTLGGGLLGLLYAGLIALKPTLGVFVALHLVSLIFVHGLRGRWREVLAWAGCAVGSVPVFLAPWLLLHWPLYRIPGRPTEIPPGPSEKLALFSRELSGYGTAQFSYTLIAIVAVAGAVVLLIRARRQGTRLSPVQAAAAAAGLTAAVAYAAFMMLGAPKIFGPYGATRYACPVLIAALPCMMRLIEPSSENWTAWIEAAIAAIAVAVAVVFLPATIERPRLWWKYRTPLAFLSPATTTERLNYIAYNRQAFTGLTQSRLQWLQNLVPPGEPLAVWVTTPFLLDFRRNEIFNADPAGLSMRWTHWPRARYFLLEYQGTAVHTIAELQRSVNSTLPINRLTAVRSLQFLYDLQTRARSGTIVANDGAFALIQMDSK